MRLVHCSDVHLGKAPYQLDERFDDFCRVFEHIARRTIELRADALLIAGDLFDRRTINAATLSAATRSLALLQAAGVPVFAIEGNHDKAFLQDRSSWMQYLSDSWLLHLLDIVRDEGSDPRALPWNPESRRGTWFDLAGVRIAGVGYAGSETERLVAHLAEELPADRDGFTALMLHCGVGSGDGRPEFASVAWESLEALHGRVDYVALGHWHRKVHRDLGEAPTLTVTMPGSPEICDIQELQHDHGIFIIGTPASPDETVTVTFEPMPHRHHRRIAVDLSECGTLDAALSRVRETVAASDLAALSEPVVEIVLSGTIGFSALDIPSEDVRAVVRGLATCLHIAVENNANMPSVGDVSGEAYADRGALERQVLLDLVAESEAYRDDADAIADLVGEWRSLVATHMDSDDITGEALARLERALEAIDARARAASQRSGRLPGFEALDNPSTDGQ